LFHFISGGCECVDTSPSSQAQVHGAKRDASLILWRVSDFNRFGSSLTVTNFTEYIVVYNPENIFQQVLGQKGTSIFGHLFITQKLGLKHKFSVVNE
jgi:hypothetical protein